MNTGIEDAMVCGCCGLCRAACRSISNRNIGSDCVSSQPIGSGAQGSVEVGNEDPWVANVVPEDHLCAAPSDDVQDVSNSQGHGACVCW